jgi:hypothetical protein
MAAIFNYQIASKLCHFREAGSGREARLTVLLYLTLRANVRLRCWPGIKTIAADTGIGKPRVVDAVQWLVEHGALYVVPVDKRIGKEVHLNNNRNVYQLTGIIHLDGSLCEYLYLNAEAKQEVFDELKRLGATEVLALLNGSETEPEPEHGTESEPTAEEISSESEPQIGTESEPESAKVGSVNGPIELYPVQNLSSEQKHISAPKGAKADEPPSKQQVSEQKTRSQQLFDIICRRGFKLDPTRLPRNPDTGKTYDGGRIGKLRRELLQLYPTLTPQQLSRMYDAYYRALPQVQYLKSIPRTLEYMVEFMQTGTIRSPLASQQKTSSGAKHDFRSNDNASTIYLSDELHQLDLPAGYREWLDEHYWTRAPGNGITGADLVLGLQKFQRGA